MQKTEIRGEHATGFYACEQGQNGVIFYDKEPVKSTVYCRRSIWCDQFAKADADLLIAHCRQSSIGVGSEKCNKNNHPHVNSDVSIALVHNGRVADYDAIKNRYDLHSDCDSEILLGMFETSNLWKDKEDQLKEEFPKFAPKMSYRLMGIKEIFSRVNYGAMAVAIAERETDGGRRLWLLRDDERPLHVVDMRDTIGQIFFCSTPEIWRNAMNDCPAIREFVPPDQEIIEFTAHQVWTFHYSSKQEWEVKRFKVNKVKYKDYLEEEDKPNPFKRTRVAPASQIVTRLDYADEIVVKEEKKKIDIEDMPPAPLTLGPVKSHIPDKSDDMNFSANIDLIEKYRKESVHMLEEIGTVLENAHKEGNIDRQQVESTVDAMKSIHNEIEAALIYIR